MRVFHYINNNSEQTVQMFGNNQDILALVKNPHLHKRLKHIDISYHFIKNLAEKKKLDIAYIPTEDIIADKITKPLARIAYKRFRNQLGIVDSDTFKTT